MSELSTITYASWLALPAEQRPDLVLSLPRAGATPGTRTLCLLTADRDRYAAASLRHEAATHSAGAATRGTLAAPVPLSPLELRALQETVEDAPVRYEGGGQTVAAVGPAGAGGSFVGGGGPDGCGGWVERCPACGALIVDVDACEVCGGPRKVAGAKAGGAGGAGAAGDVGEALPFVPAPSALHPRGVALLALEIRRGCGGRIVAGGSSAKCRAALEAQIAADRAANPPPPLWPVAKGDGRGRGGRGGGYGGRGGGCGGRRSAGGPALSRAASAPRVAPVSPGYVGGAMREERDPGDQDDQHDQAGGAC